MSKKEKAPQTLLGTPVVLDGRAIPAWGMVLTADLLSSEVRGLSAVALRLWLSLIAVAGGNTTGWNCSVKHLVTMVGASDRQVYRAMSDLEKAGLLRRHRTGRSTRYELVSPGQLARVGKAPTPDTHDTRGAGSIPDRTVRSELTPVVRSELTELSVDPTDNDGSNRESYGLQRDLTERSNRTPPNPPTGGGRQGDMSDTSDQDATRTRERSSVDTGRRSSGTRALHTWASGPHLKRWIHERLKGLTAVQFEVQRDDVLNHLERGTDVLIASIVTELGVRKRRALELHAEAKQSAIAYTKALKPEPFSLDKALNGYRERLEKQNLLELADVCQSEEEVSQVLRDLVMRECGF